MLSTQEVRYGTVLQPCRQEEDEVHEPPAADGPASGHAEDDATRSAARPRGPLFPRAGGRESGQATIRKPVSAMCVVKGLELGSRYRLMRRGGGSQGSAIFGTPRTRKVAAEGRPERQVAYATTHGSGAGGGVVIGVLISWAPRDRTVRSPAGLAQAYIL